MLKGKLAVLGLVAISLLVVNGTAFAGIIDPCLSSAALSSSPAPLAVCPQGDTDSFTLQGWQINLTIKDALGVGIANIAASDFWIIDCSPTDDVDLCGGSASSGADSLTNASGATTMSNTTLAASTCGALNASSDKMKVIVQGFAIKDPSGGCPSVVDLCLDIIVRAVDLSGDGVVDTIDLTGFAQGFPPNPYDTCTDYNQDGLNDLVDLSEFALHFGPPGHSCS